MKYKKFKKTSRNNYQL